MVRKAHKRHETRLSPWNNIRKYNKRVFVCFFN